MCRGLLLACTRVDVRAQPAFKLFPGHSILNIHVIPEVGLHYWGQARQARIEPGSPGAGSRVRWDRVSRLKGEGGGWGGGLLGNEGCQLCTAGKWAEPPYAWELIVIGVSPRQSLHAATTRRRIGSGRSGWGRAGFPAPRMRALSRSQTPQALLSPPAILNSQHLPGAPCHRCYVAPAYTGEARARRGTPCAWRARGTGKGRGVGGGPPAARMP